MQRKIDALKRLVIPSKFFKELEFTEQQEVQIFIERGKLSIQKFQRENWQDQPFVGIVRSIDKSHRVCIPIEFLNLLETIHSGDIVNLELENTSIKIKKIS